MRNLAKYPITTEECLRTLENELEKLQAAELVGDTRPLILKYIYEYIDNNSESFEEFLKTK